MCGAPGTQKRNPPKKEIEYLDALVRGVYAKGNLPEGYCLTDDDVYLAIPLQKGQLSCRELMRGNVAEASEERCADYNRRYREPVSTNSITSSDDLPARSGRRQGRVTARTARPTAPGKRSVLGTIVVVLIALLFVGSSSVVATAVRAAPGPGGGVQVFPVGIAQSQHSNDIARLLEASWVVLLLTAVGSAVLGWFIAAGWPRPWREITARRRRFRRRPPSAAGDPRLQDAFKQLATRRRSPRRGGSIVRVAAAVRGERLTRTQRTPLTAERTLLQVALADRTSASSRCGRRARSCSHRGSAGAPARIAADAGEQRARARPPRPDRRRGGRRRRGRSGAPGVRPARGRAPLGAVAGRHRGERGAGRAPGREPRRERARTQRSRRRRRRGPHRDRGRTRCWPAANSRAQISPDQVGRLSSRSSASTGPGAPTRTDTTGLGCRSFARSPWHMAPRSRSAPRPAAGCSVTVRFHATP